MKKLLSLLLTASMLLALAACGTPAPEVNPPLVLGEKYLSDLDYEQALLQFDQAIEIEPKNPRGYLGKADALLHLERQEEAVQTLSTAAKAVAKDQREAMQTAQAEVEKSAVDGYIGLSAAYEKLGWREIALLLLQRVCEELPEESRLREALEGLINSVEDDVDTATQEEAPVPDGVFTIEDAKQFGLTWDSDPYEVADKFGVAHSEVDRALAEVPNLEDEFCTSATKEGIGVWLMFDRESGFYGVEFGELYSGPRLPHNIYIGMNIEQLVTCFYYEDEIVFDVLRQQGEYLDFEERFTIYQVGDYNWAVIIPKDNQSESGSLRYYADSGEGCVEMVVDWNYNTMKVTRITVLFA